MKYAVIVSRIVAVILVAFSFGLLVYVASVNNAQEINLRVLSLLLLLIFLVSLGFSALLCVYAEKLSDDKKIKSMMKSVVIKSEEVANTALKLESLYSNLTTVSKVVDDIRKNVQENVGGLNFSIGGLQETVNTLQSSINKYNKDVSEYFRQFSSTSVQLFSQLPHNKKETDFEKINEIPTPYTNAGANDFSSGDYFNHYTDNDVMSGNNFKYSEEQTQSAIDSSVQNEAFEFDKHVADEPVVLDEPIVLDKPINLTSATLPNGVKDYIAEETKDEVQKNLETIFNDELADTLSSLDIMHDDNSETSNRYNNITAEDFAQDKNIDELINLDKTVN